MSSDRLPAGIPSFLQTTTAFTGSKRCAIRIRVTVLGGCWSMDIGAVLMIILAVIFFGGMVVLSYISKRQSSGSDRCSSKKQDRFC